MEVGRSFTPPRKRRKVVDSRSSPKQENAIVDSGNSIKGALLLVNSITQHVQAHQLDPAARETAEVLQQSTFSDPLLSPPLLSPGLDEKELPVEDTFPPIVKPEVHGSSLDAHVKAELQDGQSDKQAKDPHTYKEALAIRQSARDLGVERFIDKFGRGSTSSLLSLCTIFGVAKPALRGQSQVDPLLKKLRRAVEADMKNRIKLRRYDSFEDATTLVRDAKKILVITGAGISTSLDIPDFRSSGGLYSKLREMGFAEPENVFSRDTFEQDPKQFFSVASMILPRGDGRFSPAHGFLRLLQDKGKLLTIYTQNIDGIDFVAGISEEKLIQLHGSFATATCITCGHQVQGETIFPNIRSNIVPICALCQSEQEKRLEESITARAITGRSMRPRHAKAGSQSNEQIIGILRPDIVFMGEPPRTYLARFERDCAKADLVLVIGSSLPVEPVKSMPNHIPPNVPQIYISKDQMTSDKYRRPEFDIQLLGECDVVVELLAKECGWDLVHEMLPNNTSIEVHTLPSFSHCHAVTRKPLVVKHEDDK